MILSKKQKQVDKIKDYIMEHRQIFDKLVIFGEATYEDLPKELEEDVFLDVAVKTVREKDATNDDICYELASAIDDATDGKFNLIIINDPGVATNVLNEIENGEVIYDAQKDDSGITGNGVFSNTHKMTRLYLALKVVLLLILRSQTSGPVWLFLWKRLRGNIWRIYRKRFWFT